ncbi:MAG: PQQ-binding-like beta-propeller repeat protein [Phycisphaerales bacterium JB039]
MIQDSAGAAGKKEMMAVHGQVRAWAAAGAFGASACCALGQSGWPTLARGPARIALTDQAPTSLAQPAWIFRDTAFGAFTPIGLSGVVTGEGLVFAVGELSGASVAVAIEQATGELVWVREVPEPVFDSWSTPAYDEATGALYIGAGTELVALRADSGDRTWITSLGGEIVNGSPVITSDLGAADRAFVVDSSGFGGGGRLHCVNIDPFHMAENPFVPGEVVWSFDLGQTSGSTPAYADGVVYVATAGDDSGRPPGLLFALPAGVPASPAPLWVTPNPAPEGFYGGLCVDESGAEPAIYAASYAFFGGINAGNLVKVRAADGAVRWSVPCNRTASIPVPLGDGRIALSAGLRGFGSVPSVQLFRDEGSKARLLWDSALWTWKDADRDGQLDPGEFMEMGGWTHQPAAAKLDTRTLLIAGTIGAGFFDPYDTLRIVDLRFAPGHPNFIVGEAPAGGSSCAIDGGSVFSIGPGGVAAFISAAPPCYADCDRSGVLDIFDVLCFQSLFSAGNRAADCDDSGTLDLFDFLCFQVAFDMGCP